MGSEVCFSSLVDCEKIVVEFTITMKMNTSLGNEFQNDSRLPKGRATSPAIRPMVPLPGANGTTKNARLDQGSDS